MIADGGSMLPRTSEPSITKIPPISAAPCEAEKIGNCCLTNQKVCVTVPKEESMMKSESIQVFDSQGEAYKRAFQIFLDHTDQKRNAKRFLQKLVDGLPNRNVFIDAGAGNGEVTKALAGAFCHTIAIKPNPHLLTQLKQTIPQPAPIAPPFFSPPPS